MRCLSAWAAATGRARAQIASGPEGAEFLVNSYTTSDQYSPAVASDGSGNFVVVWESSTQDGGGDFGVFDRRFDATGTPQALEFQINVYTTGPQAQPAVTYQSNGNFVVAWVGDGEGASRYRLFRTLSSGERVRGRQHGR